MQGDLPGDAQIYIILFEEAWRVLIGCEKKPGHLIEHVLPYQILNPTPTLTPYCSPSSTTNTTLITTLFYIYYPSYYSLPTA